MKYSLVLYILSIWRVGAEEIVTSCQSLDYFTGRHVSYLHTLVENQQRRKRQVEHSGINCKHSIYQDHKKTNALDCIKVLINLSERDVVLLKKNQKWKL